MTNKIIKQSDAREHAKGQKREIEELRATMAELDKVAKMLIRRDLELSDVRARREKEVAELRTKTEELEAFRRFAVGREIKMVDLKEKLEEVEQKLQQCLKTQ